MTAWAWTAPIGDAPFFKGGLPLRTDTLLLGRQWQAQIPPLPIAGIANTPGEGWLVVALGALLRHVQNLPLDKDTLSPKWLTWDKEAVGTLTRSHRRN